tara:strand:- start:149 stop:679 length:531 start_codon:yes stop_codon:yes gene_type:complete
MIKIYDKFLAEHDFELLSSLLMGPNVPWYYNDAIAGKETHLDGYQFVHNFFNVNKPFDKQQSQYSSFIMPVLHKLTPKYVLRVKANLRPKTKELVTSDWHTDTEIESKTAILYLNSNDGYTVFKQGDKVYSQANRLVLFESHMEHAGTSCTNDKKRVVLNINYTPRKMNGKEQLPL